MRKADGGGAWGRPVLRCLVVAALGAALLTIGLVGRADATAAKPPSAAQCRRQLGDPPSVPIRSGTTPASVLASYAVLRRAQVPSDVPPAHDRVYAAVDGYLASYDPAETRLLATTSNGSVYLVVGVGSPSRITLSPGCRRQIPALIVRDQSLERALDGTGPAYALVEVPAAANANASLATAWSFARTQGGFAYSVADANPGQHDLLALVPDGVGAVQVAFIPSVGSFSLSVQNNLASGVGPAMNNSNVQLRTNAERRRFVNRALAVTVTWLTAPNGAIVRVTTRPHTLFNGLLKLLRLVSQLVSGLTTSGTTVTSSSGCRPAKRDGKTVEVCKTTTQTCTPTKVNGHSKQRCTTKTTTTTTVSKPQG